MLRGRGKVSSRKRCFSSSRNLGTVNVKEDMEGKWTGESGKRESEGNVPQEDWTNCWKASGKVASDSLLTVFPFTFQPLTPPSQALPWNRTLSLFRYARTRTHTHTKSGQLQGSKFQIWLHLEEALCEFLMETRILPQKFQVIHLRNSFHFTFLQISYLDDKKSLSRKRPAYACHSIGCKGKTYSLPEKVKTLHKKRGMG